MNFVNVTSFKQNIWTYFDTLISKKEPIFIKRRKHKAMILPLDDLTEDEIKIITSIRNRRNIWYIELKDKKWINTFNKISWNNLDNLDKVILW